MPKHGLTKNDLLFIDEYFSNGFNGSRAYSTIFTKESLTPSNAKYRAYRLLGKPEVKIEVQKRWDELNEANIVNRQEILMQLKETMLNAIRIDDNALLLKTIDIINKMIGSYTLLIDANIQQSINLIIPGMDNVIEENKTDDELEEEED